MKERVKFVLEWEKRWNAGEGRMNFAELCREFGISRQVGYGWLGRYRESSHDVQSIAERSRRPLTSPSKVSDELEDLLSRGESWTQLGPEEAAVLATELQSAGGFAVSEHPRRDFAATRYDDATPEEDANKQSNNTTFRRNDGA